MLQKFWNRGKHTPYTIEENWDNYHRQQNFQIRLEKHLSKERG